MAKKVFIDKVSYKNLAELNNIKFLVRYFKDLGAIEGEPFGFELREITDLATKCSQVLVDHSLADKLLPSTSYGDDYFKDVQRVLVVCNTILSGSFNDEEYLELQILY